MPNTITNIGYSSFRFCGRLSNIDIPESVTTIASLAFYNCPNLSRINCYPIIPPSLGSNAFDLSFNSTIFVQEDSEESYRLATNWREYVDKFSILPSKYVRLIYTSDDGNIVTPFSGDSETFGASIISNTYDSNTNIGCITFDSEITQIGANAFKNCTNLLSIYLPDSIEFIGNDAFRECTKLKTITLPNSITDINKGTFESCSSLTSINIPNSVTNIGTYAFESCSSLTSINIPSGVTSIGNQAFKNCTNLTEVICNPITPPSLGTDVFNDNASNRKIKVPNGSVDTYKAAPNWSTYASDITSK